eukprot:6110412-Amphidinium_carterae.1
MHRGDEMLAVSKLKGIYPQVFKLDGETYTLLCTGEQVVQFNEMSGMAKELGGFKCDQVFTYACALAFSCAVQRQR